MVRRRKQEMSFKLLPSIISEDKMTTNRFVSIFLMSLNLLLFFIPGFSSGADDSTKISSPISVQKTETGKKLTADDTVYVIHFHPTAQCSCCINVGNFSKKSLEKYYSKPYQSGLIVFKEYNIDQDSLTAKRYEIFGSALGFKKSLKGKEEFKEIESVWEFCEDEGKYLTDFKIELDRFMKRSEKNEASTKEKTGKTIP
jgi:hypothetical protein